MLEQLRKKIVQQLWERYRETSLDMLRIEAALKQCGITRIALDHFAIIDLPSPNSGIPQLSQLFSMIGYQEQGKDYLANKQNDFLWMAELSSMNLPATHALPQAVVADFRLEAMPPEIKMIIEKYAHQARLAPLNNLDKLIPLISSGDVAAFNQSSTIIMQYLSGRDWPLPTLNEFYTVKEFNELLSWVLVFGRRPNHFTISVHLLDHFTSLADFHHFITEEVQLPLNFEGGVLKGGKTIGIAQGSTVGISQTIQLADGDIEMPTGFVEFVWRYPLLACQKPVLWRDYFTGFVAQHADHVIESLYVTDQQG